MNRDRLHEASATVTTEILVLALHELRGIGDSAIETVLRTMAVHRMPPCEVPLLSAAQLSETFALKPTQAAIIARGLRAALPRARELARKLHGHTVAVLTSDHASYPQRLMRTMEKPPTVLYGAGNLDALDRAMVAVLTSNDAPREARQAASLAAQVAIEHDFVPVTGHNRPEYQDSALAARRRDVPTCYILDRGIMTVSGVEHDAGLFPAARIWRRSDQQPGDLILSALHPTMPATPGSNRRRDEIVAGLGDVILTSWIREEGTMHRIIRHASANGTPVIWTSYDGPPPYLVDYLTETSSPDRLGQSEVWGAVMRQVGLRSKL